MDVKLFERAHRKILLTRRRQAYLCRAESNFERL
ncbi:hypothetical protein O9929_26040 [Vibrio lentus]|nr:hypothetical protein [Vibrio lentus]